MMSTKEFDLIHRFENTFFILTIKFNKFKNLLQTHFFLDMEFLKLNLV